VHRYTKKQHDFISEIAPENYNKDIADTFNEKFGTNISENQIKSYKGNHKIKSHVTRKRRTDPDKLLTDEQHKHLVSIAEGRTTNKISKMLNEKFRLSITPRQIQIYKKNHDLKSNISTTFKQGQKSWNKGMKGLDIGGKETQFKKGHRPYNYQLVGTERVNGEGYIDIKIADPNKWRPKHRIIWEKENGKIPRGFVVLFGDGTKSNVNIDNLILVSRSQLSLLNKLHLIKNDADLTRTGIIVTDIYQKISERKKQKEVNQID